MPEEGLDPPKNFAPRGVISSEWAKILRHPTEGFDSQDDVVEQQDRSSHPPETKENS